MDARPPTDHDLLIEIAVTVASIDKRINSHATRIRALERFRSWTLGGLGSLTAIIGGLKFWGH